MNKPKAEPTVSRKIHSLLREAELNGRNLYASHELGRVFNVKAIKGVCRVSTMKGWVSVTPDVRFDVR